MTKRGGRALRELVAEELGGAVDLRVVEMAAALATKYSAARAVLFYGSCLRSTELDGQMLDFYLVVSNYESAYGRGWLARANQAIPPNVFPFAHDGLTAKYAVLSEDHFRRECGVSARSASVWARFSQPARLAWAVEESARETVIAAVAQAAPTLLGFARHLCPGAEPLQLWKVAFANTYRAELRAERDDRSASIVDAEPGRYQRFGEAALAEIGDVRPMPIADAKAMWRRLQRRGKRLSVLRLAKASFTFAGGVDYLAWKIGRHSGQAVEIRPWHRRFPLVAAMVLVPRLLARGAVR